MKYLFGRLDEDIERELLKYVRLVKLHLKLSSHWMFILFSLPVVGGIILDYIINDKFDYCISCRKYFVNASYCHIAPIKIFWDHSDGNLLYQGTEGWFRKINKIRLRMAYKRYDSIWVLNDEIQYATKRAFRLSKVDVLRNPINCDEIMHLSTQKIEDSLCDDKSILNIICVRRISPEKGQYRLLKVMQKIKQQSFPIKLTFVGDGMDLKKCVQFVQDNHLDNEIQFLGRKKNPYKYIKQADLLILPSFSESFGLVLLEAMVLSVPVLTTNTVGGRSICQNGKYGKVVENTEEAILDGIILFLQDPSSYRKTISDALQYAKTFDIRYFESNLEQLL